MYAQLIFTIVRRAPLLAVPRLRRVADRALYACRADAPGRLWAYAVQPCTVRLIVGPTDPETLEHFALYAKARLSTPLLQAIRHADDETLDAVLYYNPVWGGVGYRLWEKGYHHILLWSPYRLSQAIYAFGTLQAKGAKVWHGEDKEEIYIKGRED